MVFEAVLIVDVVVHVSLGAAGVIDVIVAILFVVKIVTVVQVVIRLLGTVVNVNGYVVAVIVDAGRHCRLRHCSSC